MKKILLVLISCLGLLAFAIAQDSSVTTEKVAPKQKFTRATFNSTRIINMQSTEIVSKGTLQFMISHHFSYIDAGSFSQSLSQFFGFNSGVAHTYLSFDYSPLDYLNVGVSMAGSSRYEGWTKIKLLRQQTGVKNVPVSIALYSLASVNTATEAEKQSTWNRFSYMNQLLVSRKFSDRFSLQVMPAWIHFNVVPYGNSNEVFSFGIAGKYKATSTLNFTVEYARQLNMYKNLVTKNGAIINYHPDLLSAGIEINSGSHLFQFYVGSTVDASNIDQLARNNSSLKDWDLALGFTINRSF